jgi:hypothetical protein
MCDGAVFIPHFPLVKLQLFRLSRYKASQQALITFSDKEKSEMAMVSRKLHRSRAAAPDAPALPVRE